MTEQGEGPGVALKAAREALNVSVREVADALNLPLHVVEAIEANDYDRLPQAVFTRGYLRSYARLLELDSEAIVASYPEAEQADVTLTTDVEVVPPVYEWWRRRPVWLAAAGVVLGVIVLVSLISWLRGDGAAESSAVEVSDPAQTSPGAELSDEAESELTDDLPAAADQPAPAGSDAETAASRDRAALTDTVDSTIQADLASEPAEEAATAQVARTNDETAAQTEPVESLPAEPVDSLPAESAASSTVETDSASTPAGMRRITPFGDDVLVIGFAEDCWVEIKDVEGAALYGDLNRGGATLRLIGRAPFRVLLGYAPGVEMTFNGESIEVTRYTRNNVASITVGR